MTDVELSADVEPFSYAGSVEPKATIGIAEFSPREVMQKLDIEAPPTADPTALTKLALSASADVGEGLNRGQLAGDGDDVIDAKKGREPGSYPTAPARARPGRLAVRAV